MHWNVRRSRNGYLQSARLVMCLRRRSLHKLIAPPLVGVAVALIACAGTSSSATGAGGNCGKVDDGTMVPSSLQSDFNGFHGVATDGTFVYYTAHVDDQIIRLPIRGGEPEVIFTRPYLRLVKGYGKRVCWMTPDDIHCTVDGGPPVELVKVRNGEAADFDLDETHLYFWSGGLKRISFAPAAPVEQIGSIYETVTHLALSARYLAFATESFATVMICPKDDCSAPRELTFFGRPPTSVGRLAVDDQFVYAPVHLPGKDGARGGKLVRIPVEGGEPQDLLACTFESPIAVAVDQGTAFLVTHAEGGPLYETSTDLRQSGSLFAIGPKGPPTLLAANQGHPSHLTLLPTAVFWMNANERRGQLMKLSR